MLRDSQPTVSDKETILAGLLRLADALVIMATGYVAYVVRSGLIEAPGTYLTAFVLAGLLTLNFMQLAQVYTPGNLRRPIRRFGRCLGAWLVVLVALITLSYLTKTSAEFSRIWLGLWAITGTVALFVLRLLVAAQMVKWQENGQGFTRVAVVGTGVLAEAAAKQFSERSGQELRFMGFFCLDWRSVVRREDSLILGDLSAIAPAVRDGLVQELLVALPWDRQREIERVMEIVRSLPVNSRLCIEPPSMDLPIRAVGIFGGMPVIDLWHRPLSAWDQVIKALEDRILAAILILIFSPLMALIALAIKLDSPGPILFRQPRAGFNNNPFTMLKFRTMAHERPPEPGVPQARRNDPRVTRLGAWLRRTSLDELPQLFNVLGGQMSLVGPRPHALEHDEHYSRLLDEYLGRQRVKPGITGWAQVNGLRGPTETKEKMQKRVRYDLYYIDHWSVVFDLRILFLTLLVGFVNENAY